ncbi:protein kinase [Gigaspora margarita]|uniref:Protein kinase n=1 Tax=Gigaspora margarita TaxID=4874 RepID=A0A8H3WWI1_GIGMA|nr:protein kinase [Gigaspora margarita]
MDGSSNNRRRAGTNAVYTQSPGHKYNNAERTDYVGITISDDYSQKQMTSLPLITTSSPSHHSHQQQQLNPQHQPLSAPNPSQHKEVTEGRGRRRSENNIQNSSSGHYTVTSSSQNQNIQHNYRSLLGPQNLPLPPLPQQHIPSPHLLHSHKQHSLITNNWRPSQSQSGQQSPSIQNPPVQITYQNTYSNSKPSSPNNFHNLSTSTASSPSKSSQTSAHTTRNENGTTSDPRTSAFQRVRSKSDLRSQPTNRRADSTKGVVSPLKSLTVYLTTTYHNINPNFRYELSYNPRRVLTKPSKGVKNDGFDNEDSDYILYVNDVLGSEEGQKYLILDILGQGTFGQVVKCQNLKTKDIVAVKVVKNKPAYFNQSMMEVTILELLNQTWDSQDQHHILRLLDTFIHRRHLCLVFELLSVNLYELIKQNQFRGLSTNLVRVFTSQLLDALTVLNEARIIHCDLKPENVLLKKCVKASLESPTIKVIDFGSACHERQTVYTYIQSRFYRSPEVLLGLPYSSAIDMWSLGCIAVELFLGLPLFPGSSEYNQVSRIVEMLGVPPPYMIEVGKTAHEYFERYINEHGQKKYRLKTMEQYMRDNNCVEQPSKRYFSATTLPEIIKSYPVMRKGVTQKDIDKEMQNRLAFIDFVQGLLNLNPIERWSPQQAKLHPFITGEKFTGKFTPPMQLKSSNKSSTTSAQSIPSSSNSQSSLHLAPLPSHSQYKTPNTSPKIPHKNPVVIHEMPSVTITSHNSNNATGQRPQLQQTSNKMATLAPKPNLGTSLRPRASTIGNIQVPHQIQIAAALVSPGNVGASPGEHARLPKEKDQRRLPQPYPHLQLLPEQDNEHEHEIPQFSVVVDGEDRRASRPSSSNIGVVDIVGIR